MGPIKKLWIASQQRSDGLSPRLGVTAVKGLIVVVLVVALVVPFLLRDRGRPTEVTVRPQVGAAGTDTRHLNATAGYIFDYPKRWKVADRASFSRVVAPGRGAVISAGAARDGETDAASVALVRALEDIYTHVRVTDKRTRLMGATTRVELSGRLVSEGSPLDFRAVVLGRNFDNFAIAAFLDSSTQSRLRDRVGDILASFELSKSV